MNKFFWVLFLLVLIILIPKSIIWGEAVESAGLTLEIPETVIVAGPRISLSDLGTVKGGTIEAINNIKRVELGTAPRPGEIRTFSKEYLKFITQQYKLEGLINLQMQEQVIVKAAATCIKGTVIAEKIQGFCTEKKPNLIKKWIELFNLPEEIWLSPGDWKIEATVVGDQPEVGTVLFKVVFNKGKENKSINVSGRVRAIARVYRAKRNISYQTEINKSDFELVEFELGNGKELVGEMPLKNRSTRLIKQGEILRTDQIQPIPLVLKDHQVKVIIKEKNILIELIGIAKVDGWLGDNILIVNPTSNKFFRGKVCGNGTVEVNLT